MRSSPGPDPFRRGSDVAHAKDRGQFGQGDTVYAELRSLVGDAKVVSRRAAVGDSDRPWV
jgi:hypothetical protein